MHLFGIDIILIYAPIFAIVCTYFAHERTRSFFVVLFMVAGFLPLIGRIFGWF